MDFYRFLLLFLCSFTLMGAEPLRYLYSHGILGDSSQVSAYAKLANGPIETFNYPDACTSIKNLDRGKVVFGQKADIECLKNACEQHNPDILLCLSRGASNALNLMALHDQPNIRALIAESPFDTMDAVVETLMKHRFYIGHIPGLVPLAQKMMNKAFPSYDPQGLQPIQNVHLIRKDLPILIICSLEDTTVPARSSINLYKALRKSGHENVHILIVHCGKHSKIMADDEGAAYHDVVHAFYKQYQLPHDETAALNGASRFQQCQPTRKELEKYVLL